MKRWLSSLMLFSALLVPTGIVWSACSSGADTPDDSAGTKKPAVLLPSGTTSGDLVFDPPEANLTVTNGVPVSQAFQLKAKQGDNSVTISPSAIKWTLDRPSLLTLDAKTGTVTTTGTTGGLAILTATIDGVKKTANVRVKLVETQNTANLPQAQLDTLQQATAPDGAVQWAYPYNGTVFPQGLLAPELMWNGGTAGDTYLIQFSSPYLDLTWVSSPSEGPPATKLAIPEPIWKKVTEVGKVPVDVTVKVNRLSQAASTQIVNHTWKVAGASLEGVIYYWANVQPRGRLRKLSPSTGADVPILEETRCVGCHVVSATGNRIAAAVAGGVNQTKYEPLFLDTVNNNAIVYEEQDFSESEIGTAAEPRGYANAALTSKGEYLVQGRTGIVVKPDINTPVNGVGLEGKNTRFPSFSADDKLLAYTNNNDISVADWSMEGPRVSNLRQLLPSVSGVYFSYLSASPDHKWVVYQKGDSTESYTDFADQTIRRAGLSNLFLASTEQVGVELALSKLNGDTFLIPEKDRNHNYEPAFAPFAAGGYLWVVFTSRRSFGNRYLSGDLSQMFDPLKQVKPEAFKLLWVAAIDLNAEPGKDPSHPAFYLAGQSQREGSLVGNNLKGFWSLDQCRQDSSACSSGAQCCSGSCEPVGENGAYICGAPASCADTGSRCQKNEDCCNFPTDACIANLCASTLH